MLSSCNIFITKGFIIKEFNGILTPEIKLIIECCKLSQNSDFIESNITLIKDWDDFLSLAYSHGIFPLIYKTLKNYTQIPVEIQNTMKYINMNIVKQNMLMTSELLKVTKFLEENGIEAISFKGPVLSQMAYGDVVSRQYCDLDILINKNDLLRTVNLFLENNYINILPLEIISNNICLNTIKDFTVENKTSKLNIEIHWNLFETKYDLAFRKLDILKSSNILINQNKIRTISNETLLIYLCLHGSKHAWERIEWISDIDRFIRNNELDFSEIDEFLNDNSLLLGLYLSYILFDTPLDKKYIEKIKDKKIKTLSKKVLEIMIDKRYQEDEFYRNKKIFYFQIFLYEKLFEKINFFISTFFKISAEDCQTFHLKEKYKFLYIFLRPFRIARKYLKKQDF